MFDKLLDVLILAVLDHRLEWVLFSEFHFEEIYKTGGLADFESLGLVVVHAVPLSLSPDCKILSAIDIYNLPGDLVAVLRGQVDDGMTNFFDSARSAHGIIVLLFLHD